MSSRDDGMHGGAFCVDRLIALSLLRIPPTVILHKGCTTTCSVLLVLDRVHV